MSSQLVDSSTDVRRTLLAQTLAKKAKRRKGFPLSYAQQRLWFLNQLEPGDSSYNIPIIARLTGPVDFTAFEQTFSEIIRRHEVLRTTFGLQAGQPVQFIGKPEPLILSVVDVNADEVERVVNEEISTGFDLTQGPLLRVSLLRLDSDNHFLLITLHHIISDGWSMDVLVRELSELYQTFSKGESSRLTELPIQYVDYAAWQREWLQGEALERELDYWRQQLGGATTLLELPAKQARPAVQSYRGAVQKFQLPESLSAGLKQLCQTEQATLFMVLLAGFQILLYRYSGQADINVGTPIAGRTRREVENLIGFFVNTLVLRVELQGEERFRELLKRVREVCLGAYAHQELPFEKLVEELQPERSLSHSPLFQVMFMLQHHGAQAVQWGDLELSPLEATTGTSKFDLVLTIVDEKESISGSIEYSTDLFDPDAIDRMVAHYQMILEAVASNPEQRISGIEMISSGERQQLLSGWSKQSAAQLQQSCIHTLFEAQVEQSPDAPALTFGEEQLTYNELNRRANQLAHHLRNLGVREEQLVGLYLERSPEMIVAILAVLKAGAAYLPLDDGQPRERLLFMLGDAEVSVVLTGSQLLDGLPETGIAVICLDQEWEKIATENADNPVSKSEPTNLAYAIYTSGSTGKPKAAMVTHANVTRLFTATEQSFRFSEKDVWTMFHSYAFDFSVWEMWGALLYGGRLVIVPYWISRTPDEFHQLLNREQVTVLNQTPSAFRMLMQADERGQEANLALRVIIFGGEALDVRSLRSWFLRHGEKPQLVNMYGITETTVHVTHRRIRREDLDQERGSVIGWAISDLEVYLLDENMQPAPVGVAGEIFVGGAGLARGYLNRAELTAERFVPHPYSDVAGATLYRTGDRGRFSSDGDIEYLGRVDHQVKIRGFRIETSEIELALCAHEKIKEAVVVVREDAPGEKCLVAYVMAQDATAHGQKLDITGLRDYLLERLPEYMIPSYFVAIDSLPLTANGKVDLRALPAPQHDGSESSESFIPPRTAIEKTLADIWATVLGVAQVGIADNFFALGGDSIRSVRVAALAKEQGLNVTLPQLFQYQTIGDLSEHLTISSDAVARVVVEPFSLISNEDRQLLPSDVEDAYPLTMLQAGMLFHSDFNRESALYNNSASLHVRAPFDARAMESAVGELIDQHAVLRTAFDLNNYSRPLQLVHRAVELPLQMDDLRELSAEEQQAVISGWQADAQQRHMDWSSASLLRFQIHPRSDETFQFSFVHHHAILDGWSVATLLTELFNSYLSLLGKSDVPVQSQPASSFRDFVALEQKALASTECEQYWREKLSGADMVPLPRWRSSTEGAETHQVNVRISRDVSDGLKRVALAANVPIKSVLLAAHLKVMSLLGGKNDVLTGVVSHGRPEEIDAERAVGLYLNTLPFRLKLQGGTWLKLSQEVFAAERELLPYRHYPMAQVKINEGGQPLFETLFTFNHFHVFDTVKDFQEFELISENSIGETEFAFTADFSLNTADTHVNLILAGKGEVLCSEQVQAIGSYYLAALRAIAYDPTGRYDRNTLLVDEERQQLPVDRNDIDLCVHELIEQHAEQAPDAVAVCHQQFELSYAQLNRRANQLAHQLLAMGVQAEQRVGIYIERSPEMIVALLAVLKAGAAYVPIDPVYPPERVRYILEDSQASVLLTKQYLFDALLDDARSICCVCLDSDSDILATQPVTNPKTPLTKSNLAYLIYTSGSTGQPKAVMIAHGSLAGYTNTAAETYAINSADRVLQFFSFSFDASAEEIFTCLTRGATLVLRSEEMMASSQTFVTECGRQRVTVVSLSTSFLHVLSTDISAAEWEQARDLRLVIFGGESALPDRVRAFMQAQGERVRVVHTYGPTEATIVATMGEFERGRCLEEVGIGKPVTNTQIYILAEGLQLVPVGVVGELYIGGEALARGYLGRQDLTAERFIPNPFGRERGGRLYRTGDRARYMSDGNIEYVGRVDQQVKIRGYRVETGEIEAALSTHETVRDVVVIAREDTPGDKRLVAYLVTTTEMVDVAELRGHLRERLPEYMVPSFFVLLEQLPLTASGKIDRATLPIPERAQEVREVYVGPRTATEEIVAGIFAEVLGLEQVSVEESFFELGGHSLLAMQIVSRIRDSFGIELPLRALFEAPAASGLADRVDIELRGQNNIATPALTRVTRDRTLPLSFAQQRLWFLDRLEPNSPLYNISLATRVTGKLDIAKFEQAFNEITKRHEMLRTVIAEVDDQPVQVIQPAEHISLPVIDLSQLAKDEQKDKVAELAAAEAKQPFNLATGPLYRIRMLRLTSEEHVLLFTLHHIIADGWSMDVLVRELSELYQAFSKGERSRLTELPIQYVDYAAWQREWLQGEALERELDYWRQQLGGATTLLELPAKQARPAVQSYRGAVQKFQLPESLSAGLKQLCQTEQVTLFMVLLAGFQILLYRYSGQADINVGTPIAGRTRREVENLIGFFVNTLVLRVELQGEERFRELLKRVREVCLGAYAHQELPFEKLVEELQPERSLSHSPLFQVMFMLQHHGAQAVQWGDLELTPLDMPGESAKFDLTLSLAEAAEGLEGAIEYNRDLFDEDQIQMMLKHYEQLLEGIAADPQQRVWELPLLNVNEKQQMLEQARGDQSLSRTTPCFHKLFEEQVERTPDAVAVVYNHERLSYQDLNGRANQLAHELRRLGVGPESIVAICMERSTELIVAVLGILKAGGAYLPLDPKNPAERISFLLEDAGASVLLTHEQLLSRLPSHKCHTICLDAEWQTISQHSVSNLTDQPSSENLAYVIYTSGSTGKPKGVMIPHGALTNYLLWAVEYYRVSTGAGAPVHSSLSFDLPITGLFCPLLAGNAIHLLASEQGIDVLSESLKSGPGFSLVKLTPAHVQMLTYNLPPEAAAKAAQVLVIGGEALPGQSLRFWQQHAPHTRLINEYGPTETVVGCSIYEVKTSDSLDSPIPIGRPIANAELYILDKHQQLVPSGVTGELYIGGAGVARGYLQRPELTAQMFIPNPFSREPGTRLYKTGDLARYNSEGEIVYLGRGDYQIKLRGHRIELGEVEAVLSEHEGVAECLVMVRELKSGEKRMVGYVVGVDGREVRPAELRSFMKERLPEYMVPVEFVSVEEFPLTPAGKVDRKALLVHEQRNFDTETPFVAPRTFVEEALAGIWSELLGIKQPGIYDNFFDLGGHSLLLTTLASRIRTAFNADLSLRVLFEQPTIDAIAMALLEHQVEQHESSEIDQILEQVQQLSPEDVSFQLAAIGTELQPGVN